MWKWLLVYAVLSCTAVFLYLQSMTVDRTGWCSPWDVAYAGCVDVRGER